MKKGKTVSYECTWRHCGVIIPDSDERIREQIEKQRQYIKERSLVIRCPECMAPMRRKVFK